MIISFYSLLFLVFFEAIMAAVIGPRAKAVTAENPGAVGAEQLQ